MEDTDLNKLGLSLCAKYGLPCPIKVEQDLNGLELIGKEIKFHSFHWNELLLVFHECEMFNEVAPSGAAYFLMRDVQGYNPDDEKELANEAPEKGEDWGYWGKYFHILSNHYPEAKAAHKEIQQGYEARRLAKQGNWEYEIYRRLKQKYET